MWALLLGVVAVAQLLGASDAVAVPFAVHTVVGPVAGGQQVAPVDLDADGLMDYVTASELDNMYEHMAVRPALVPVTGVACACHWVRAGLTCPHACCVLVRVTWFRNTGGLTFQAIPLSSTLSKPQSVYPIDVDKDGLVDVLVASSGDGSITYLRNNGTLAFTPLSVTHAMPGANSVFAGDVSVNKYEMAGGSERGCCVRVRGLAP